VSKDILIACASEAYVAISFSSIANRSSAMRKVAPDRSRRVLGDDAPHDSPQHAVARYSTPERRQAKQAAPTPQREPDEADAVLRLKDEISICASTIAKELAIGELNRRLNEDCDKFVSAMQDMSYKLGAAETRLAQIEVPKTDDDAARRSATPKVLSQ
jgi:hypothetical protein